MENDVTKLLQNAANTFAQLATVIEDENRRLNDRINHLENKVERNRETLKTIAQTILDNLD
jgi:cell division septum initiation protein DivIVA